MGKLLWFIVLVLISVSTFAQVKPIYFIKDQVTTDSAKATSYGIYGKLSTEDLWLLKRYDLYDNLMLTGSYKDNMLKIPHGKFTYYEYVEIFNNKFNTYFTFNDRERFTAKIGSFINGKQNGLWLSFYPDGKIFTSYTIVDNLLQGEHVKYDKKGIVATSGRYVNGKKDGEWISNSGLRKDIYHLDTLLSSIKNKKLLRREYGNTGFN